MAVVPDDRRQPRGHHGGRVRPIAIDAARTSHRISDRLTTCSVVSSTSGGGFGQRATTAINVNSPMNSAASAPTDDGHAVEAAGDPEPGQRIRDHRFANDERDEGPCLAERELRPRRR